MIGDSKELVIVVLGKITLHHKKIFLYMIFFSRTNSPSPMHCHDHARTAVPTLSTVVPCQCLLQYMVPLVTASQTLDCSDLPAVTVVEGSQALKTGKLVPMPHSVWILV